MTRAILPVATRDSSPTNANGVSKRTLLVDEDLCKRTAEVTAKARAVPSIR